MPRWNAPKLTQAAVIVILIAATGAALTWLAQTPAPDGPALPAAPGESVRGARRPRPAGAADRPTGSSCPPAVLAARAGPGPA